MSFSQGTFGREPQAKPEDDRYLRAAIQEYDNIAKLGQIMREGPIKVRHLYARLSRETHIYIAMSDPTSLFFVGLLPPFPKHLGEHGQRTVPNTSSSMSREEKQRERPQGLQKRFRSGAVD